MILMILSSKYCFFAAHYISNWLEINAQSNRHLNASVLRVIHFQGVTFFVLTFSCWEPCSHQNNTRTCPWKIIISSVQWINRKWIEIYSTNVVVLTLSYTTKKKSRYTCSRSSTFLLLRRQKSFVEQLKISVKILWLTPTIDDYEWSR